jgi:adenylate cyclase
VENKPEPSAWLESAAGERLPLEETLVLGRAPDCQAKIDDARVSRRHAMINRQGGREFWLLDLGSANGTRLNGRRVSQPTRLRDKDTVELAGFTFVFRDTDSAAAPRRPEPSATDATVREIQQFNCWLLLADMVDSTEVLGRLQTEEAARLAGRWLAECKLIIDTCHGVVNKFLGDGFLAYWPDQRGIPAEVATALRALKVLQVKAQPAFRMVLHYGPATSGGVPSLGEESLGGREVTFVFRIEDLASSLGADMLLSEAATRRLPPDLRPVSAGTHPVNGFEGPLSFFSLGS